jgi:hypothetical protein
VKFIGTLLDHHLTRYPRMEFVDIYKLLHQAAMGAGHAIDMLAARERLEAEIRESVDGPREPVIDPISPDGRLARVHLRAYAEAGRDLDTLLDAFGRTAREYTPSRERLERFCGCLADLAREGRLPFDQEAVTQQVTAFTQSGYPIVHHSTTYRDLYRPAYRVVAIDFLPA